MGMMKDMAGSIQRHVACCLTENAFIQPLHDAHYLMSAMQQYCKEWMIDYSPIIAVEAHFDSPFNFRV